jgi:hypothetical protein
MPVNLHVMLTIKSSNRLFKTPFANVAPRVTANSCSAIKADA